MWTIYFTVYRPLDSLKKEVNPKNYKRCNAGKIGTHFQKKRISNQIFFDVLYQCLWTKKLMNYYYGRSTKARYLENNLENTSLFLQRKSVLNLEPSDKKASLYLG